MEPISVDEARLIASNPGILAKLGVNRELAALRALGAYPINRLAADILLDAVDDVTVQVPVLVRKHGCHKTYSLLSAIIASGVYTNEELCSKYKKSALKKAATTVRNNDMYQYGINTFYAYSLLSYMKQLDQNPLNMWVSSGDWFTNDYDHMALNVTRADAFVDMLKMEGTTIEECYKRPNKGQRRAAHPNYGTFMPIESIRHMVEDLGIVMPSEREPGVPIIYDVQAAVWLHKRYGEPYHIMPACKSAPGGTYDIVKPDGISHKDYRAFIKCMILKWGGAIMNDRISDACNRYIVNEERQEDVV